MTADDDTKAAISAKLRAAGAEFQAVRTSYDQAKEQLLPLIVEALRTGIPPTDVVDMTGYTRERVRTIAREHGIEKPETWSRRPRRRT